MSFFKDLYFRLYILRRLIKKELKSDINIPFKFKARMWRNGFFSASYILYNFKENDIKDYLSDYRENVNAVRINKNALLLDNKLKFYEIVKDLLPVPEDLGKLENGIVRRTDGTTSGLLNLLIENQELILKPIDSSSGTGVIKITKNKDHIFFNEEVMNSNIFLERISILKNYMVSIYIKQADYSAKIYGKAVSTIRILTMISPYTQKAFIAAAAHRFVTDRSFPVDNCNAGGLTALIDMETGKLGKAVSPYFSGKSLRWHENHPDTGSRIEGIIIPHWDKIKSQIIMAAQNLSYLKYIGWDVAVTNEDFIVIEGNDGPDLKLHQVHKPLLIDKDVRDFYEYYKVI